MPLHENPIHTPVRGGLIRPATAGDGEYSPAPVMVETFISMWLKGDKVCPGSLAAVN